MREGRGSVVATCAVGGVINQVQAKVANQLMFQQAQKLLVKVFSFGFQSLALLPCCHLQLSVKQTNSPHTHTHTYKAVGGGGGVFTSSHPLQQLNMASKNNAGHAKCFAMCARLMDLLPLPLPCLSPSLPAPFQS